MKNMVITDNVILSLNLAGSLYDYANVPATEEPYLKT
jgi:hypothetical protein